MKKQNSNTHLDLLHNEVPGDYYDQAIHHNIFQKFWHKRRFHEVNKYLPLVKLKTILDIGCHGGTFTSLLKKKYPQASVYGIDVSSDAILYGKKKYKNIIFKIARAENLPFKHNSFDLVTCFEVMEHVDNPQKVLQQIKTVLVKRGQVLFLVPSETLLFKCIWFVWSVFGPGRIWHHTHIQQFDNNKLDILIENNGFQIIKRRTFLLGMLLLLHAQKKQ